MEEVKYKALLKYRFIYSPRTTYNNKLLEENKLYLELLRAIDPYSIKILKKHFKERLGNITKDTFISILKRHLITWNYSLENRDDILIKLLSRLFDEIDVDSNGVLSWNEFMNYTINEMSLSYNNNKDIKSSIYYIQKYRLCQQKLNLQAEKKTYLSSELKLDETVSYSFYIEKYKLLGIVFEGQSKIVFYNMETFTKSSCVIYLNQIDDKVKRLMIKKISKKIKIIDKNKNSNSNDINISNPDSERKDIKNNNKEKKKIIIKNIFKKEREFYAVCAIFIEKLDLLFISSSNRIISAWHYEIETNEFININNDEKEEEDKTDITNEFKIPLYGTELLQYCICFDLETKSLFSGQEDGKIFKWTMNKSRPVNIFEISQLNTKNDINKTIDEKKVNINFHSIKEKKDEYTQNKKKETKQSIILANKNKTIGNAQNDIKELRKKIELIKEGYNKERVSCLLLIDQLRLLCSGHYNGYIILWDLLTNKPKKIYNDQKTGIYQLEYNDNKNQIYSCGLDHNIYAYDPYHKHNAINIFKGHLFGVNSISFNSKCNELISVDKLGNIIIWNVETCLPYQIINRIEAIEIEQQKHSKKEFKLLNKRNNNLFVKTLQNVNKFIVYGEKLLIYEKELASNNLLCDDYLILGCKYIKSTNDIITFSFKRVKFWSIFTGKIHKIYDNLMEDYGITAFEIDKNEKKFYLGGISGKVKCFNLSCGNVIKEYKSHEKEITNIIQSYKYKVIITSSLDLQIMFHSIKDDDPKDYIIKEMYLGTASLRDQIFMRNIILDENSQTLIISLSSGTISFFDMVHFQFFGSYNINNKDIENINKLENMNIIKGTECLFVSHENGEKYIMVTYNNKYYSHLLQDKFGIFENEDKTDLHGKSVILQSEYDVITQRLFLGSQIGVITCYDLSPLVKTMNTNYDSIDSALKHIHENLYFPIIYKIDEHIESITFVTILHEIEPRILLCSSTDRVVGLYDIETGNYIDSLKQFTFRTEPIPIGIKYIKDNPFLEIENEKKMYEELYNDDYEELIKILNNNGNKIIDNKHYVTLALNNNNINGNYDEVLNIIYKDLLEKKIKMPTIDFDKTFKTEIIKYANKLIEYYAKIKLKNKDNDLEFNQYCHNKSNTSNFWNYKVDLKKIIDQKNAEFSLLKEKIDKRSLEVDDSENAFQHSSIFNYDYKPLYLRNEKNKDNFYRQINNKLRNIHMALAKKKIREKDNENFRQFELKIKNKHNSLNYNLLSPINSKKFTSFSESNMRNKNRSIIKHNKIFINKKSKNSINNINSINSSLNELSIQGHYDKKFKKYEDKFNENIKELNEPIKILLQKRHLNKSKLLPKLSTSSVHNIKNSL